MTVLVTGATGTLGRIVVDRLIARGHDVRGLTRQNRTATAGLRWYTGDLATGDGLDAAVAGVRAIVHCATNVRRPADDVEGTRRLVCAARRGGSPHLVFISIVGVDRVPLRYYRAKLSAEELVAGYAGHWTILRATQFHDLIVLLLRTLTRLPVVVLPRGVADQPIDAAEVADRLAVLAEGEPAGRVPDLGGPQVRRMRDLARAYLRAAGRRRRPIVELTLPGRVVRAYRAGGHLAPEHAAGGRTFEQFLDDAVRPG